MGGIGAKIVIFCCLVAGITLLLSGILWPELIGAVVTGQMP